MKRTPKEIIRTLIDFPPPDYPRRTKDGYPSELMYDEFAYKRMVDCYRRELKKVYKTLWGKKKKNKNKGV